MNTLQSSQSLYGLDKANALLITVDCCRADTFEAARLPYIKSLGVSMAAKTHGTHTLPSHMSFFGGYLPGDQSTRKPYYNPNVRQLWRLESGRSRDLNTVGLKLNGSNIIEGYRNLGYYTLGTGGVRWFRNEMLQAPFDDFLFYGPDDQTSVFAPRRRQDFALNNQPEILEKLAGKEKVFLFIDCLETHVPYDTGEEIITPEVTDILSRGQPIWGCKTPSHGAINVTAQELESLHKKQIAALETIDNKVKELIRNLPKPLLFVITGDHGECFGEDMLWGHGYPHEKVMEVPLLITMINN